MASFFVASLTKVLTRQVVSCSQSTLLIARAFLQNFVAHPSKESVQVPESQPEARPSTSSYPNLELPRGRHIQQRSSTPSSAASGSCSGKVQATGCNLLEQLCTSPSLQRTRVSRVTPDRKSPSEAVLATLAVPDSHAIDEVSRQCSSMKRLKFT